MKLNKKVLSCFLAGTMVMAPMSAFAEDAPGSSTITGEGTVGYVDAEIYDVILPTDAGIAFNVDPLGLLGADGKDLATILSDAAGSVTSSATAVVNKSSVDIKVNVETYVSAGAVTLAKSKEEAESGGKDLYLAITQLSGAAVTGFDTAVDGTGLTIDVDSADLLTGSATAVTAVTDTAVDSFSFTLEDQARAYEYDGSAKELTLNDTLVTSTADNTYVFAIAGYANPKADVWEDEPELQLTMKFTISGADAAPAASTTEVTCVDGAFDVYVLKSDLGDAVPAYLWISVGGEWYDLAEYATVEIDDSNSAYYKIVVSNYEDVPGSTCELSVLDSNWTPIYEDASVSFE